MYIKKRWSLLNHDFLLLRNRKNHLTLKDHLPKIVKQLGVDCVIDVGANVGQFALDLMHWCGPLPIYSFEPNPNDFEKLALQARPYDNWQVANLALGEQAEQKN